MAEPPGQGAAADTLFASSGFGSGSSSSSSLPSSGKAVENSPAALFQAAPSTFMAAAALRVEAVSRPAVLRARSQFSRQGSDLASAAARARQFDPQAEARAPEDTAAVSSSSPAVDVEGRYNADNGGASSSSMDNAAAYALYSLSLTPSASSGSVSSSSLSSSSSVSVAPSCVGAAAPAASAAAAPLLCAVCSQCVHCRRVVAHVGAGLLIHWNCMSCTHCSVLVPVEQVVFDHLGRLCCQPCKQREA